MGAKMREVMLGHITDQGSDHRPGLFRSVEM
jgi:hypothetical protein